MHCTKISFEFEFGGQRSKKVKVTRDNKRKNAAFFRESSSGAPSCAALHAGAALRRWENQRMLSSIQYSERVSMTLALFAVPNYAAQRRSKTVHQ